MKLSKEELEICLKEWGSVDVRSMPISTRALNGLIRSGVKTLADLACYTIDDLYEIPNFGKGTVGEVLSAAAAEGLIIDNERLTIPSSELWLKRLSKLAPECFEKGSESMKNIKKMFEYYVESYMSSVDDDAEKWAVANVESILDDFTKSFERIVKAKVEELTGIKEEQPKNFEQDLIPPKQKMVTKFRAELDRIDNKYHHSHAPHKEVHTHHFEREDN